jgi:hypothetical protein
MMNTQSGSQNQKCFLQNPAVKCFTNGSAGRQVKIIVVKGMLSRVEDVCQPLVSMNTTLPYEVLF